MNARAGVPESGRGATTAAPWPETFVVAVLALVTVACWFPALRGFFAADDFDFLERAARPLAGNDFPIRWLSGPVAWKLQHALFGLHAMPYHAVRLAAHAGVVLLVFLVGRRILATLEGAAFAATVFAVSPVAFTPLHWASGQGEIGAALFALAATLAFLRLRTRPGVPTALAACALAAAAMLCKETAAFLPVPWLVLFAGEPREVRRHQLPVLGVVSLLAVLAFAAWVRASHVGGDAYATSFAIEHLARNLATYLDWGAGLSGAIPDQVAAVDPRAWPAGLWLGAAIASAVLLSLRQNRRPELAGAAWLVAFLAPVLPLTHHTYFYYLYLPWVGACWLLSSVLERFASRLDARVRAMLFGLAGILVVVASVRAIRTRESASANGLPIDRTIRESLLVRNTLAGLDPEDRDSVAFVNPYPKMFQSLTQRSATLTARPGGSVYTPLEAALRGGQALRIEHPGLVVAGFDEAPRPEWGGAAIYFYENDGRLVRLGRGMESLRKFGRLALHVERWDLSESVFRRLLAGGDTSAEATYGLIFSLASQHRDADARGPALEFVRRFPADPRSEGLRAWLASSDAAPRR